ncbi:major facilitator transporter [Calothrix sp. NIES-4071]|nr:major facilitator transporter [Calothrix sp. NIES-4071]BAZ56905.1 major facilitator transporter [Calothrix sp. NIES-4105]
MELNHRSDKNILQDFNVYIIISLTLIPIMGELTIAPILPDLAKLFNVSLKEVQLVITIFFLPVIIATPIFGILGDRMGIKKLLVPSLLLYAVAGGYSAFAQDFQTLLWWRFIQGLGATSLNFMALTIISMMYRGKALTTVMSLNVGIIGISTTIFPIIGGVLGGFSWRYPFLLAVSAFPLLMLVLMVLKLPQKPSNSQNANIKIYLQDTWNSINNPRVLKLLLTLGFIFAVQSGAFIIYIPILAGVNLGASGLINGVILSSMSVSVTVVALQLGKLTRRISEINLIKIAFIIIAIALIMIPTIHNAWLLIIPCLLFGVGEALAIPSSQALLAELAVDNVRAGFMAVNAAVQSIAQVAGPLTAGIFFSLWGIQGVFWGTAGITLATFALFNFLLSKSSLKDKKISREV